MDNLDPANLFYFNSHAHVERDATIPPIITIIFYFNSHAHVERDAERHVAFIYCDYFNSHAHVERDPAIDPDKLGGISFQLTRSRGA